MHPGTDGLVKAKRVALKHLASQLGKKEQSEHGHSQTGDDRGFKQRGRLGRTPQGRQVDWSVFRHCGPWL